MNSKFLFATVAIVAAANVFPAWAADPEPYEFAGLRLGMTMEDFRKMAPTAQGGKAVCTGDAISRDMDVPSIFSLPPELSAAGVKRCAYFGPHPDGKLRPMELDLRGVPATAWSLFYAEGAGAPHRLTQINLWIPTPGYGGVVKMLASGYGPPKVQNSHATIWDNGVSEIVASFQSSAEPSSPIFFIHRALQASLSGKLGGDKPAKAPGKKK
jgi:hypothetical protein